MSRPRVRSAKRSRMCGGAERFVSTEMLCRVSISPGMIRFMNAQWAISLIGAKLMAEGLLFVANFVADTVTVIDTRSREVTATVPVGTYPHDVVRAPGGRIAVCSYGSGTSTVIDPASALAKTELETGRGTSHCAFLHGGELGLFANSISKDVTIVDMEKTTARATIPVAAG